MGEEGAVGLWMLEPMRRAWGRGLSILFHLPIYPFALPTCYDRLSHTMRIVTQHSYGDNVVTDDNKIRSNSKLIP